MGNCHKKVKRPPRIHLEPMCLDGITPRVPSLPTFSTFQSMAKYSSIARVKVVSDPKVYALKHTSLARPRYGEGLRVVKSQGFN
jgi:hypothetical protein